MSTPSSAATRLAFGDASSRPPSPVVAVRDARRRGGARRSGGCARAGRGGGYGVGRAAGVGGRLLAGFEEPADPDTAVVALADLTGLLEHTGPRRVDLGLDLVGLDHEDRIAVADGRHVVDEPLQDRSGLHREAEFGHLELGGHRSLSMC